MLERNILALLSHGFQHIVVAVSAGEKRLISFANDRAARLAEAAGANLKIYVEKRPLGTIGAARTVDRGGEDLLVVNVDNLTSLDLSALFAHHQTTQTAMTIATHTETFQVPFGQVVTDDGRIIEYREKPILPVLLSSGTYVLGSAARRRIPVGKAVGVPDLVRILLEEKLKISAFPHSSLWTDVNDSAAVGRAEVMIATNYSSFELWCKPPEHERVTLGVVRGKKIALARTRTSLRWCLPFKDVLAEVGGPVRTATLICKGMQLPTTSPRLVASFDEFGQRSGRSIRHHLFCCEHTIRTRLFKSQNGIRWFDIDRLSKSHGATRTLAYLKRYAAPQNSHSFCH